MMDFEEEEGDELPQWVDELIQAQEELQILAALEKSRRWSHRRWLVHPLNQGRQRHEDFYDTVFQELKDYPDKFKELVRMEPDVFQLLLWLVKDEISPLHETSTSVPAEQRLAVTLIYLAHGVSVAYLSLTNRIAKSTIYNIIDITCTGIYTALSPEYLKFPDVQTWRNIGQEFGERWQMPGCLSAIDGKHVQIIAPDNSGSLFYNYKGTFSIVLMAAVNHNYEFTWVDVGQFGGQSDGGILSRSDFGIDLENNTLNIPRESVRLPNTDVTIPYYFIGDEAFKLRKNFMKPFPGQQLDEEQRVFNYRLSRARRCVESAFGILAMRWRILAKRIDSNPDSVEMIVNATVCLHNFLSSMGDTTAEIERYKLGQEGQGAAAFGQDFEVSENRDGYAMRELLRKYFVSPQGQVPWQLERVRRGLNVAR